MIIIATFQYTYNNHEMLSAIFVVTVAPDIEKSIQIRSKYRWNLGQNFIQDLDSFRHIYCYKKYIQKLANLSAIYKESY